MINFAGETLLSLPPESTAYATAFAYQCTPGYRFTLIFSDGKRLIQAQVTVMASTVHHFLTTLTLAFMLLQIFLSQAHIIGGHFNQLVITDKFKCLLQ